MAYHRGRGQKNNDKKLREAFHKEHPPVTKEQEDSQCGDFDSENYQANKEKCDLLYKDVERNEAGDHWLGGVLLTNLLMQIKNLI